VSLTQGTNPKRSEPLLGAIRFVLARRGHRELEYTAERQQQTSFDQDLLMIDLDTLDRDGDLDGAVATSQCSDAYAPDDGGNKSRPRSPSPGLQRRDWLRSPTTTWTSLTTTAPTTSR
jgi:hypothetical protein